MGKHYALADKVSDISCMLPGFSETRAASERTNSREWWTFKSHVPKQTKYPEESNCSKLWLLTSSWKTPQSIFPLLGVRGRGSKSSKGLCLIASASGFSCTAKGGGLRFSVDLALETSMSPTAQTEELQSLMNDFDERKMLFWRYHTRTSVMIKTTRETLKSQKN